MDMSQMPRAKDADIALLLEGSYPFVAGGVSSWMHQMILGHPEIRFAVIFLGSTPEEYTDLSYELPENVVHFQMYYLFSENEEVFSDSNNTQFSEKEFLHQWLVTQDDKIFLERFKDLDFYLNLREDFHPFELYKKDAAWQYISASYLKYCTDPSFVDYFWNIVSLQKPIQSLIRVIPNFISVKAVHTISTGYAGFLAALLHHEYHYPVILTEHGIYTRERRVELWQKNVAQHGKSFDYFSTETDYFQDLWLRFFDLLALVTYEAASPIISLYTGAQLQQIEAGADASKTQVIPNGVDILKYKKFRRSVDSSVPQIIALVGRIVPVKDIKTFLRAAYSVVKKHPNVKVWIVGNEDENPGYAKECHELVSVLNLTDFVEFKGWRPVTEILAEVGLVVLSSISEGMPLIVLESFAAGIPVVATDVGSCRVLIDGDSEEDQSLGASGAVVQIGNSIQLALAIQQFLSFPEKWQKAQQVAIQRVEKYYDEHLMFARYKQEYKQLQEH